MLGVIECVNEKFEGSIDEMIVLVFGRIFMRIVENVHDKSLYLAQVFLILYLLQLWIEESIHEIDEEDKEKLAELLLSENLRI